MSSVEDREDAAVELVCQAMASGAAQITERLAELRSAPKDQPLSEFFRESARSFVGIRRDLVDPLTGASPELSDEKLRAAVLS